MSVNFLTTNIVLIYFSPGDGGKFLTNMLGLSSNAVLQNANFAEQQLEKNFNTFFSHFWGFSIKESKRALRNDVARER